MAKTMVTKPAKTKAPDTAVERKRREVQDGDVEEVAASKSRKKPREREDKVDEDPSDVIEETEKQAVEDAHEKKAEAGISEALDESDSSKSGAEEDIEDDHDELVKQLISTSGPEMYTIRPVFLLGRSPTHSFSFYNMPPYKLRQWSESNGQITSTSHTEYTLELLPEHSRDDEEDRASLADHVHSKLYRYLVHHGHSLAFLDDCKIDVGRSHKTKSHIVTILWPRKRDAPSLKELKLKIKDISYFFRMVPPCIDNLYRTINAEMSVDKDVDKFLELFEEAIEGRASIVDLWRLDEFNTDSQRYQWNGTLRILIAIKRNFKPSKIFPRKGSHVTILVGALPGYIYYDEEAIELQYIDRGPWCSRCKPSVDKYHSNLYCPVSSFLT